MRKNDEDRMTNDELMTKSGTPLDESDDAFWEDATAPMICEEPDTTRVYDLEERTARFGETVIDFAKSIPQSAVTHRIINQLVGAGTSVGANYVEADDAISKKRIPEVDRDMQERDARGKALSAHGCPRSAGIKT